MKTALTIAGSDPSGGAGIQADLKVFRSFGVHGLSVPACVTAQNTKGVKGILPIPGKFITAELDTLLADFRPDAIKTGMLYGVDAIRAVYKAVRKYDLKNLVIDPVMISSSGKRLLEKNAVKELLKLIPFAEVITPNTNEASALSGIRIRNIEDVKLAARKLKGLGPETIVITGGHLGGDEVMDFFYDGKREVLIKSARMPGNFHGTGCAYSAALTASLALGQGPLQSAKRAKKFMQKALANAFHPGTLQGGMGILKL